MLKYWWMFRYFWRHRVLRKPEPNLSDLLNKALSDFLPGESFKGADSAPDASNGRGVLK